MKIILFLLLLSLSISIFSQKTPTDKEAPVIELTNKSTRTKERKDEIPQKNQKSNTYSGVSHFPNSIYIGELGNKFSNDKNRNRIIDTIDNFLKSLSKKSGYPELISQEFGFLFNEVYLELFSDDLISWLIGYPEIEENISITEVELHFRSILYTGFIYLDKNSEFVVDLQLDIEEEIVFDPSSPY